MPTPKMAPTEVVKVLWMDDEPDNIINYKNLLSSTGKMEIEVVKTVKEAKSRLETEDFHAFVADLKMDLVNDRDNGAKFLADFTENNKFFPTFISSAWVDDVRFAKHIKKAYPIMIDYKNADFTNPILENPFFKSIYNNGINFNKVKHHFPENITLKDYLTSPRSFQEEVETHWKKHSFWITSELKGKEALWGVACNLTIVASGADLLDFPDEEELIEIGEKYNRIPFAYTIPIAPETIPMKWNRTTINKNVDDFYPALKIKLNNRILSGDFDTGAFQSFISSEFVQRGIFNSIQDTRWNDHLAKSYEYYTKKIPIEIEDVNGKKLVKKISVSVVKNWEETSFVSFNKNRKALLGRDILRAFELKIYLDSKNRVTYVEFY